MTHILRRLNEATLGQISRRNSAGRLPRAGFLGLAQPAAACRLLHSDGAPAFSAPCGSGALWGPVSAAAFHTLPLPPYLRASVTVSDGTLKRYLVTLIQPPLHGPCIDVHSKCVIRSSASPYLRNRSATPFLPQVTPLVTRLPMLLQMLSEL